MATVYLGRMRSPAGLTRTVAIKRMHPHFAEDPAFVAMFFDEARLAMRLHHPNIVPTFGVGEHDGLPYYVMQFIQGLGLDAVLEELKRLKAGGGSLGQVASLPLSARPAGDATRRFM